MSLLERAAKLLKANVNHMLDAAEDPEVMIKQLVREMDESIVELRRETVNAAARQKQLHTKGQTAQERAEGLVRGALLAVDRGDKELARKILGQRLELLKRSEALHDEERAAASMVERLKTDLARMEGQADLARSKREELIRRRRAAESQLRTQWAARRSTEAISSASGQLTDVGSQTALDGYSDAITELEARAEATREMTDADNDAEAKLHELVEPSEVERPSSG